MHFNRTTSLGILKIGSIAVAGILIILYAISRSLSYARGPGIQIFEPRNGSSIASSSIVFRGRADRVNKLSLDGAPISIDQQGDWSDTVIIFPGMNVITVRAEDQFGRSTETKLDLFGTVELPAAMPTASSTSASTSTARSPSTTTKQ